MRTFFLGPHDLSWLYRECPRCFWMKTRGLVAPKGDMPAIFQHIDRGMKKVVTVELLTELGIPAIGICESKKLVSIPLEFPEFGCSITIRGYDDRTAELVDGTFAIIEAKTSSPNPANINMYWPQVMAYTVPLEKPADGKPREVSIVGLLCFDAYEGSFTVKGRYAAQRGTFHWIPVELDRAKFYSILGEVAELLGSENFPAAGTTCNMCRHASEINRYLKDVGQKQERVA